MPLPDEGLQKAITMLMEHCLGEPRPSRPPVLLTDTEDTIERIVVPASVWQENKREVLQVGRRVCVAGHCDLMPKLGALPVALYVELIDVH